MAKKKDVPTRPAEAPPPTPEPTQGERPAHEFRLGRVRCSIWKNESDNGPWYSVKLTRLYKTDDGWKASAGLNRDDLLPAAKLCEEAALWIFRQQQPVGVGESSPATADDPIPF
jgi:hypothetical protein